MESIKQEIVNNVYENGEQLITGPVLQEVLLDLVDDYNGKIRSGSVPQDLVGKTGSWDDAADWIEDNSGSLVHTSDLDEYATEQWVEDQGYLKEHQDISGLATTQSLNELSESVAQSIADIPEVDLSGYATTESVETLVNETSESVKEWVEAQRYLTSASLSGSVTEETVGFMINDATASVKEWVEDKNYATETYVSESIAGLDIPSTEGFATTESLNQLSESVANDFANLPQADLSGYLTTASYVADSASFDERINAITGSDLSGYATTESLNQLSESVAQSIADIPEVDLSGYATTSSVNEATSSVKEWVQEQGYLTEHQDISNLATTESVNQLSQSVAESIENIDLSEYATTSSVESSISEATESVKEWVEAQRYLTTASLSGSVTEESVQYMINDATSSVKTWVEDKNYATETFVSEAIAAIPGTDLTGYATEAWVQEQGYLTEHQDISGLATTQSVVALSESVASLGEEISSIWDTTDTLSDDITSLSESVARDLENYVQERELTSLSESISSDLESKADDRKVTNLSESVAQDFANLNIPDVSGYATIESLNQVSSSLSASIAAITGSAPVDYVTTSSFNALSESVAALSESVDGSGIDLLWSATNALEGAGILEWNDESEEYTAVDVVTSESLGAVSESFSRSIEGLNNEVAGKANARDLTSLSESVADDFANLDIPDVSGLATTSSVTQLSESVAESIASIQVPDVSGFLPTSSYLVDSASFDQRIDSIVVPDVAGLATTESVNQLSSSFDERINNIVTGSGVDLSGYATTQSVNEATQSVKGWVEEQGYLTEHQDISGLATTQSVNNLSSSVGTISSSFAETIANIPTGSSPDLSGYATTESVNSLSESVAQDFENFEIPDVSIYATTASLNTVSQSLSASIAAVTGSSVDLSEYVTTASFNPVSASFNDVSQSYRLLNRFLFATQSIVDGGSISLPSLYSNWNWNISGSQVFPLASSIGQGHSIEVFVHNVGTEDVTVSFNSEYTSGLSTFQSIVNGVVGAGSFTIPAGEYGDIVVTEMDSRLFFRTSLDVEVPEVDLSGYATTSSLNSVSESLSASIAAITSSGGGSGTDTDLRNYLFGVATQQVTGITGSVTNLFSSISQNSTLGFSDVPDEGRSLSITVHNTAASTSTITLPESVVVGSDTFNLINNGVDGSGSMSIPAGEYGDIVVTRHGSDIYVRTSVNLDDINVDLSGYATTSSLNSVSESLSASIAAITSSGGVSGDYLPLTGGELNNTEEDTTILSVRTDDGGTIELGAQDGIAGGESWIDIYGTGGEINIHNTGLIDFNWEDERDWKSVSLSLPKIEGEDTIAVLGDITALSESVSQSIASIPEVDLSGYATTQSVNSLSESVAESIADMPAVDLSGYATTESVNILSASFDQRIDSIPGSDIDLSEYATTASVNQLSESVAQSISDISIPSGGVWVAGSGTGSARIPNAALLASGDYSIAHGLESWALGQYSHAEGVSCKSRGTASHAEGWSTYAAGRGAHTEGDNTSASNDYEHAQGKYNVVTPSQIFSVGVGSTETRRKNAISIITGSGAVSSASVYIYGIGGYDGTNPIPGTNDVVSVIAGLVARIEALESGSNA